MGTKKKKTTDSVPFSADKLRYQIESHNFTQTGLAEELGFGANYLSKFVNGARGELSPRRVTLLLETVGIHYEDYLPDPEPEVISEEPKDDFLPWDVPQDKTITVRLDEDQLAQIGVMIREQVYEAMKTIWGTN